MPQAFAEKFGDRLFVIHAPIGAILMCGIALRCQIISGDAF
jgi:hypothetical protein